jgi:hypothetical protein
VTYSSKKTSRADLTGIINDQFPTRISLEHSLVWRIILNIFSSFYKRFTTLLDSKVLLYKTIIKPIWTYVIELWGCASKSHIDMMQRRQSKILRMITNAPWYVSNQTIHVDLHVLFIKNAIQEKSIKHHAKLRHYSNAILQPLLAELQRRRLKKFWPADLIDG